MVDRAGFSCAVVDDFPLAVLRPAGLLDSAAAVLVRRTVRRVLTTQPELVLLDVAALRTRDDLALSIFPAVAGRAERVGAALMLVGASPDLAGALRRVAAGRAVRTQPSVAAALAAHTADPPPRRRHAFFPPLAASAEAARALVDRACTGWGIAAIAGAAQLVTSELVANAIRHAGTEIVVAVTLGPRHLQIAVRDGSPARPRRRTPDPDTGGHGLLIVEGLASAWGTASTPTGKVIWATLRRPAAHS